MIGARFPGPIQPLIQGVPELLSPVLKRPGREADHSLLHQNKSS